MTTLMFAQRVQLNPNVDDLPGGEVLQSLTDGVGGFALYFCLIALVVCAALWALGMNSNNYQQTTIGKRGSIVCAVAVMLISGAPEIVNFFYRVGQNI